MRKTMNQDFANPEFWAALIIGIVSSACLLLWLRTGARRPSRYPESPKPRKTEDFNP
jgi:hypothetical protein